MRTIAALGLLASFIGCIWAAGELAERRARFDTRAMRCPDQHAGQPLATAIYHDDGSLSCHYLLAPRRPLIEQFFPRQRPYF